MEKLAYILLLASCVYLVISCWWVRTFFRTDIGPDSPREATPRFAPPVSVLKPVKGLDPGAYDSFASFVRQDYADYEVIFAVADPQDPAVAVIQQVQRDFPESQTKLITGVVQVNPNPKVSSLVALTQEARHSLLVISDSDMRVTPDYLREVVGPLEENEVGMVTCCYRGIRPTTCAAKLEALHMGVTFLPEVIVARRFLEMHFALGATIALRKDDLETSGGWASAGAFLAEDTRLALQIRAAGKKVVLSPYIVDSYLGATTWREQFRREIRWARTNRVIRPREYTGIILTFTFPLALVLLPLDPTGVWGWSTVAAALLVRWITAWLIIGYTGNRTLRRWLPWLPLRDVLSALTWCTGVAGTQVRWRGDTYRLRRDGRLEPQKRHVRPD